MTMRNEKFEELLSQHLMRELEPQRGKAAAAFQAQVAAEAQERAAAERARRIAGGSKIQESWARREVPARALWWWMGVPSLIAACLALVVTLPYTGTKTNLPTDAGTAIVNKSVREAPGGGILNEGGSGGGGVGGGGTLVGGMEIVPEKPAEGGGQGGTAGQSH